MQAEEWLSGPSDTGQGVPGHFCDALEQGSEVEELGLPCMAKAKEARGLNVTFLNLLKKSRQTFSLSPKAPQLLYWGTRASGTAPSCDSRASPSNRSRLPTTLFPHSFHFQFLFNLTSPVS